MSTILSINGFNPESAFQDRLALYQITDSSIGPVSSDIRAIFRRVWLDEFTANKFKQALREKNATLKLSDATLGRVEASAWGAYEGAQKALYNGYAVPHAAVPEVARFVPTGGMNYSFAPYFNCFSQRPTTTTRGREEKTVAQLVPLLAEQLKTNDTAKLERYLRSDILPALQNDEKKLAELLSVVLEELEKLSPSNKMRCSYRHDYEICFAVCDRSTVKSQVIHILLSFHFKNGSVLGPDQKLCLQETQLGFPGGEIGGSIRDLLQGVDQPCQQDSQYSREATLQHLAQEPWK